MRNRNQHVVPTKGGDWAVRKSGSSKATRVFRDEGEAVRFAREVARKDRAELYIHRKDGTIRDSDSFGRDPHPPRDKRA
jgi:hypothetical protein